MGIVKKTISSGGGISSGYYLIELSKWGIKNDLTLANATTDGINNALIWAKANEYNHVYLPAGRYSISMVGVLMVSNMWLELDPAASLELVTNSSTGYAIVSFYRVFNSKISGGKIIGDVPTHMFQTTATWVRGGINPDGSTNADPNFIRSVPLDRRLPLNSCLDKFRLWTPSGGTVAITATGYSFYEYKDTISAATLSISRTDGVFAPTSATGRGWITDKVNANLLVFTIDITATPMTDANIALLTSKIDGEGYTHEWGYGVSIDAGAYIEVDGIEISQCIGDGVYTGWIYSVDPTLYTVANNVGHHVTIRNCNIHHCRRQAISLTGHNDVIVENNELHHIGYNGNVPATTNQYFTAPGFGIDIESMVGEANMSYKKERLGIDGIEVNYRIMIRNNYIHHNNRGHYNNADGTYCTVEDNIFEGQNIGGVYAWNGMYQRYYNNTVKDAIISVNYDNYCDGLVLMNGARLALASVHGATIKNVYGYNSSMNGAGAEGYFGAPSVVIVATGTFTVVGHGMGSGAKVVFEQWQGKVPTGLTAGNLYYTANVTADTFQVSTTLGGTTITITDVGTAGFIVARWDYGKAYIENVVMQRNDPDTATIPNAVNLSGGLVIKNLTLHNVGFDINCPDNWLGRPIVMDGLVAIDTGGKLDGAIVSNSKFISSNSSSMSIGVFYSLNHRCVVENSYFENVTVDLGRTFIKNCTFIKGTFTKINSSYTDTVLLRNYLENIKLDMHWIDTPNKVRIAQSTFNNVTRDIGVGVNVVSTFDLLTGVTS